jgi:hypothetical protein
MATLLYQDHLIVASSHRIETTGKWGIWVGVYWGCNGQRLYQVFNRLPDTFDTKGAAEEFGLQLGRKWIENPKTHSL